MKKLSIKERSQKLKSLAGWELVKRRNAITKTFNFKDFTQAFSWMTAMAIYAEKKNHHPEWFNVYSTVKVILSKEYKRPFCVAFNIAPNLRTNTVS